MLAAAGADATMPAADGTHAADGRGRAWRCGTSAKTAARWPARKHEAVEAVKMCVELGNDVNAANDVGRDAAARRRVPRRERRSSSTWSKRAPCSMRATSAAGRRSRSPTASATATSSSSSRRRRSSSKQLMTARGLSTEGQSADGTECLDCVQTHPDQARAALERDRQMEAEFAKSEAERLSTRRQ